MLPSKLEQTQLVKTIGKRMREARLLCNWSQETAAHKLGYANSSKLAKVELAIDTKSVPVWLICRAAKIYEVSTDYLFGFTDDWEIGARMTQEREISSWLFEAWERSRSRDMEVLSRLHRRLEFTQETLASLADAAQEAKAALARFVELNPEFEDMPAGSRLVSSVERTDSIARDAKERMRRFRIECEVAAKTNPQIVLF